MLFICNCWWWQIQAMGIFPEYYCWNEDWSWLKATTRGPWSSSSQAFNFVSFEQSHHKLMWLYAGGPPSAYISMGLWWNCSNGTGFISLVKMSSMGPRGGLKPKAVQRTSHFDSIRLGFWCHHQISNHSHCRDGSGDCYLGWFLCYLFCFQGTSVKGKYTRPRKGTGTAVYH